MRSFIVSLAVLGTGMLAWPTAAATNIRVLVASGSAVSVRVPIAASVAQSGPATGLTAPPLSGSYSWTVTPGASGGLSLNGQEAGSDTLYLPPVPGSTVEIAGRTYRGGLLLKAAKGGVSAVNVLDLEDYLRGVVPAEMPSGWPLEALKSQAVVARTYAAARINPGSYYDLCATDSCQVYGGVAREATGSDAAIAATRAQVVSYAGAAAKTYFSSDSGGFTASSLETWGQDVPYLVARPDPASQGPNSRWTFNVPLRQVADIAARYGVRVGALRSVTIVGVSASGRVTGVALNGASGSRTLQGADAGGFVRSLGAKSSRVNFSGSDPLVVSGAGSGHGVGLSQYGASGLARQGWNYLQIMGFYYGGASISSILGADVPGGRLTTGVAFAQAAAVPLAAEPLRPNPLLTSPLPTSPLLTPLALTGTPGL
ncbi:SpoIID/LytB domain-containing protein [Deinococcus aquiradiocola]|uniref:Sporulation protein n=1 Tax=Deinococcus aquiradiocola TaxID=393059 RepID=A0A917UW56_9DEIO|nr:SpoIID/LytB domain-containing protein [Deinococcus aquiradiocola]GGJ89579.1 sporulation protein [Deinococcus aquiradiocola]